MFDTSILPAMTHRSETWTMTKVQENKLRTTQRKMERIMLGVTLKDKIRNEEIRMRTGIKDIIQEGNWRRKIPEGKHRWAGHIGRMKDNRWTRRITEWTPRNGSRAPGRPKTRWRDDIERRMGVTWMRNTEDRIHWRGQCPAVDSSG